MMRKLAILTVLFTIAGTAFALENTTASILGGAWPVSSALRISEIGRGVGVVFSPDLSVARNCRFYEALGFACFQDADWNRIIDGVYNYNLQHPDRRIYTLVLETHGTNGNGLKLQKSYAPTAERSYAAIGALQERLEPAGIYYIIVSACNSGRLLRPYIHNELDVYNGDRLFLPATCGIINASPWFDDSVSAVTVVTPESSHIETTLVGSVSELAPATRKLIAASARAQKIAVPPEFAISDIMMQILTRDAQLELAVNHYVDELSPEMQPADRSEELFKRFRTYLNAVAMREGTGTRIARRGR
jgi:hypothetical protein